MYKNLTIGHQHYYFYQFHSERVIKALKSNLVRYAELCKHGTWSLIHYSISSARTTVSLADLANHSTI